MACKCRMRCCHVLRLGCLECRLRSWFGGLGRRVTFALPASAASESRHLNTVFTWDDVTVCWYCKQHHRWSYWWMVEQGGAGVTGIRRTWCFEDCRTWLPVRAGMLDSLRPFLVSSKSINKIVNCWSSWRWNLHRDEPPNFCQRSPSCPRHGSMKSSGDSHQVTPLSSRRPHHHATGAGTACFELDRRPTADYV